MGGLCQACCALKKKSLCCGDLNKILSPIQILNLYNIRLACRETNSKGERNIAFAGKKLETVWIYRKSLKKQNKKPQTKHLDANNHWICNSFCVKFRLDLPNRQGGDRVDAWIYRYLYMCYNHYRRRFIWAALVPFFHIVNRGSILIPLEPRWLPGVSHMEAITASVVIRGHGYKLFTASLVPCAGHRNSQWA